MIHILYVEDDPNSRSVVRMAQRMNPGKFDLVIFNDSENFEQKLSQLDPQPELILLDIHMKPYTGFEMLEMIRTHHEYDGLPVVALTASVMNEEVLMLQNAGFQGAVSKPLNMDEFPDLLTRIMNGERVWYVW